MTAPTIQVVNSNHVVINNGGGQVWEIKNARDWRHTASGMTYTGNDGKTWKFDGLDGFDEVLPEQGAGD